MFFFFGFGGLERATGFLVFFPPALRCLHKRPSTHFPNHSLHTTTNKHRPQTKTVSYYFLDLKVPELPPATRAKFERVWREESRKYPIDQAALKKLYEAVDVIGVSGKEKELERWLG